MSLREFAARLGVSDRMMSKWEAAGSGIHPRPVNQAALDTALAQADVEVHARFSLLVSENSNAPATPVTTPGELIQRGSALAAGGDRIQREEGHLARREMLGLAGGAIAGSLLPSVEKTRRLVDSALGMPPSELDAEEWERVAEEYSPLVGKSVPIGVVLSHLLADFDELRARIQTVSEDFRGRFVRVASLLSSLIAISLLCAGQRLESNRYWRTAQRAADSTGDPQLASLIRARRAVYELYQGADSHTILNLADTALRLAGNRTSSGKISARAAQAQVTAKNGGAAAAQELLHELERNFDDLPECVRANESSQWGWTEQRLRFVQSFVHSYAGNMAEATAAQDAALRLYPRSSYRGPAQVKFHRAIAMMTEGDQVGGAQYVSATLEAVPEDLRLDQMIHQPAILALDMVSDSTVRASAIRDVQELMCDERGIHG